MAHSQLKAVLGALNDELDRLADLADGSSPTGSDVASEPPAQEGDPEHHDGNGDRDRHDYHDGPDQHG